MIARPLRLWWWRAAHGPSAWPRRAVVAVLAFAGFVVSLNLAFFQYGLVAHVWEPFFGTGSRQVLMSSFSRALPVHDAALGAAAYAVEIVLELSGGTVRWRRRPWLVLLMAATAGAMALTALGLIALQTFVIHAFCSLCLLSAAISLTVPALVLDEAIAAGRQVRRARRSGWKWPSALRGAA